MPHARSSIIARNRSGIGSIKHGNATSKLRARVYMIPRVRVGSVDRKIYSLIPTSVRMVALIAKQATGKSSLVKSKLGLQKLRIRINSNMEEEEGTVSFHCSIIHSLSWVWVTDACFRRCRVFVQLRFCFVFSPRRSMLLKFSCHSSSRHSLEIRRYV